MARPHIINLEQMAENCQIQVNIRLILYMDLEIHVLPVHLLELMQFYRDIWIPVTLYIAEIIGCTML